MNKLPNEVLRMILENLNFERRSAIERVATIFKFLNNTFPIKKWILYRKVESTQKKYWVHKVKELPITNESPIFITNIERIK